GRAAPRGGLFDQTHDRSVRSAICGGRKARENHSARLSSLSERTAAPDKVFGGDLRLCTPFRRRVVLDWRGNLSLVPQMRRHKAIGASLLFVALCCGVMANAAPCRSGGPYDKWLADFEREAVAQGISQQAIAATAPYLTYDQRIVNIDRGQRVFTQTFLEFSDRMAAAYRIQRGGALIKTYASVFARIDKE